MRTIFQKADLVAADSELTQREEHGMLPPDYTPGYVDLLSLARGYRPSIAPSQPGGSQAQASTPTTTPAGGPNAASQPKHTLFSQRGFLAGTTQAMLLPYREGRSYLFIQNNDAANDLYITFGVRASSGNAVKIPAGGFYEPYITPSNDVYVLGSAANVAGMVVEGFANVTLQPMSGLEAMQIERRGMVSFAMTAPQQRQAQAQQYTVYMPDGSARRLTDSAYNSESFRREFFHLPEGW